MSNPIQNSAGSLSQPTGSAIGQAMSAQSAAKYRSAGSSLSGKIPPVVEVDAESKALCDMRYIGLLDRIMGAHCRVVDMESLRTVNLSMTANHFMDSGLIVLGRSIEDLEPIKVELSRSYVIDSTLLSDAYIKGGDTALGSMWNIVRPYALHALLSKGIIPCRSTSDGYSCLLLGKCGLDGTKRGAYAEIIPVNFIESSVDIPVRESGAFNLRSVQELINAAEYE